MHATRGLHVLCHALRKLGIIRDPIAQFEDNSERIREAVYRSRFGCFAEVMFPRFKSYAEYCEHRAKDLLGEEAAQQAEPGSEDDIDKLFDSAKKALMLGK